MRSASIFWQVFLATLATVLGVLLLAGIIARQALSAAFDAYLQTLPSAQMGQGQHRGMGRMMLGAAEQTFLATVDRSVIYAAGAGVLLAVVVAFLFARYLTGPIRRLEAAALSLADGDLSSRADVGGPHEVAALGEAFNEMADGLQESEELRRRLVADVAHELRNPIAAARAQAEGMAEGVLALNAERLGSLVEDMEHLTRLVDDLQELALAEAGKLTYVMHEVDIRELARRETDRASSSAHANVDVGLVLESETGFVIGDEMRLSQVLRNLLSNALRHTLAGSVTVSVRDVDNGIEVSVADTGTGIPDEDIAHVFERFYRADTARAAGTGGAGLGLAITKQIVTDHGGSVFARANAGDGATVGFVLPKAKGEPGI